MCTTVGIICRFTGLFVVCWVGVVSVCVSGLTSVLRLVDAVVSGQLLGVEVDWLSFIVSVFQLRGRSVTLWWFVMVSYLR